MAATNLDPSRALDALQHSVSDFTRILRSGIDPGAVAIGYWTVGDTAAHVSHSFGVERDLVRGDQKLVLDDLDGLGAFNDELLASDPERDPRVLADRIEVICAEFVDLSKNRAADDFVVWHGHLGIPAVTCTAIMLSELLVHGYDIATASKRTFDISHDHACIVFEGLLPLIPHYVNRSAAAGFQATYEVSMRGGPRVLWTFDEDKLTIEPRGSRRVDCHISADPVEYLLVGYGRKTQWGPVLKGKLVAYGRKPWLGMKLPALLANP